MGALYTMHKIIDGVIDGYKSTGSTVALEIASSFVIGPTTALRAGQRHAHPCVGIEYGGMNDCLYGSTSTR